MIGFDHLGNLGRLGNQMFEFAALRGIAAHHGYDICIPPAEHEGIENYSLHDCFKLDHIPTRFIATERYAQEPHFHFSKELFEGCPDNVSLYGFFQTEKYFANATDIVRKDFTFHDNILQPCADFMSQYADQEPIMLHVRRGDANLTDPRGFKWSYTQCSHQHPPQTLEYYGEALSHFDKDQPVIVFSDSPEWVQEQEFFGGDRFVISVPEDKYSDGSYEPYIDLCLMSLCSHAIIANSSLSWWGAWLQNGKGKVVAPKRWYGPAYADKDLSDLYCKDWIVV